MSRHRNWCFTINNYDESDEVRLKALPDWVEYCVYGKELAPKTGTPHLQGYLELFNASTLKRVKTYVGKTAHLEAAKGSQESNYKYCTKEGEFVEIGTRRQKAQGKRNDIALVKQMLLQGYTMSQVIMATDSFQAMRAAEKIKQYIEPKRSWNPEIIWIHGPPGYGKSHIAFHIAPDAHATSENYKWWQGYDAHEDVIIDNFTDQWAPLQFMLRLLDKFPFTVEYKGGSRSFLAKRIIITSVHPPQNCYRGEREFLRRIEQYGTVVTLDVPWKDRVAKGELLPPELKGKGKEKAPVATVPLRDSEEEEEIYEDEMLFSSDDEAGPA